MSGTRKMPRGRAKETDVPAETFAGNPHDRFRGVEAASDLAVEVRAETWVGERLGHSEPVVVDKSMPWMGPFAWTAYLLTVQRFHPAIGRRPLST